MLPDSPNGLIKLVMMGQPYHGLATESGGVASIALPNSTSKSIGRALASGNTHLSQRPGWPVITRDSAGQAEDAANGWQWPNWFMFGGVFALPAAHWVFFDSDGSAWQVYLQKGTPSTLEYRRFGVLSSANAPAWQTLAISGGYANIIGALYPQNHTPDGARRCYHLSKDGNIGNKVLEITLTGSGGGGPASAMLTVAGDLILQDAWTDTVTFFADAPCPPGPEGGYLYSATPWQTCDRSFVWQGVYNSDYLNGVLVHTYVTFSITLTASATQNNACSPTVYTYDRTEIIDWTYQVDIAQSTGAHATTVKLRAHQAAHYYGALNLNPGNGVPTSSTSDIADDLYLDDVLIEHATYHNVQIVPSSTTWLGTLYTVAPGLFANIGLGAFSYEIERDIYGNIISETQGPDVYPYYGTHNNGYVVGAEVISVRNLISGHPLIPYAETDPYRGVIASNSVIVEALRTSNNIVTAYLRRTPSSYLAAPEMRHLTSIATDAKDVNSLTGQYHYATYHPITKQIVRSAINPVCFV